jgi:hypothetical protein
VREAYKEVRRRHDKRPNGNNVIRTNGTPEELCAGMQTPKENATQHPYRIDLVKGKAMLAKRTQ